MHKDQRVMTPLGPGTVIGFEGFINNGMNGVVYDTEAGIPTCRVVVRLDDPSAWLFHKPEDPKDPYMFRSDLTELKD